MQYLLTGQETQRLHFRLLSRGDYNDWLPLFEHPDTGRFLGMDHLKTAEKHHATSEDDHRSQSDRVQKLTDETIAVIDSLLSEKEGEIMHV